MDIDKVIKSLKLKGYSVSFFEDTETAAAYLNEKIDNETVGFGDSDTILSMKLYESLSAHNEVYDPQQSTDLDSFLDIAKKCLTTDIFLTSVNAMSVTGELVNIDGTGNRIAGSLFGHKKVYFIVGTNKLASTQEEAVWRARNIAAPKNAKRLGLKTPCAKEGNRCYDCSSPDRICNGLMIHLKKTDDIEAEIILINKQLGY